MASAASWAVLLGSFKASLMRTKTSGNEVSLGSASMMAMGPGGGVVGAAGKDSGATGPGRSRQRGPLARSSRAARGRDWAKSAAWPSSSRSQWTKRGPWAAAAAVRSRDSDSGWQGAAGPVAWTSPSTQAVCPRTGQAWSRLMRRWVRTVPRGTSRAPSSRTTSSSRTMPGSRAARESRRAGVGTASGGDVFKAIWIKIVLGEACQAVCRPRSDFGRKQMPCLDFTRPARPGGTSWGRNRLPWW